MIKRTVNLKRVVNWILHLFGYHLTKYPRPYERKKMTPDLLLQNIDAKRCPDHGTDYRKRCNICRYIMSKIPINEESRIK